MLVSKAARAPEAAAAGKKKLPTLPDFINARDYTGAAVLLEFERAGGRNDYDTMMWQAYCYFHNGEHDKARDVYRELQEWERKVPPADGGNPHLPAYIAACLFYIGDYKDAVREAGLAPASKLQTRILFHCAHKLNDEAQLMLYHSRLSDSTDDQLSLASIHYIRNHFQEATDIYKRLLLENRDYLALNVYVALCYYKLDYYDVALEILAVYLQSHPDSAAALNLKACCHFKLYNGAAALKELEGGGAALSGKGGARGAESGKVRWEDTLAENVLIKHNLAVFRQGEGALKTFPGLTHVIPEARLNLVIWHLRHGEAADAYALIKDLEPNTPQEYILKAIVNASMGQDGKNRENLRTAQQYFQLVGASASECDTIPGRQCMASCFFLLRQWDDVLIYLKSIRSFFSTDDAFNWNYGLAKANTKQYRDAERVLLEVNPRSKMTQDYVYTAWLCRCYIMNKKARAAWEVYLASEASGDSTQLLTLIANDCYKVGAFLYAAKAFDVLDRLDPSPLHWEGKRGACVGVLQLVMSGREQAAALKDVVAILHHTSNPQADYIAQVITRWAMENGVDVGDSPRRGGGLGGTLSDGSDSPTNSDGSGSLRYSQDSAED